MNTKYISLLVALFLISCDITDRFPEDKLTDLNYWQNTDDLRSFANSFYPSLSAPNKDADNISDNITTIDKNSILFNTKIIPSDNTGWGNNSSSDAKSNPWYYIRNANYFLRSYQTAQGVPTEINHYVAEVRFFRASEYFKKVTRFGDVPWYDKDLQTDDYNLLKKARDPRQFVINKIIDDLEFATTHLKNPNEISKGRLHKFAAYQLLARVCLYEATWMKYRQISGWEAYMTKAATAANTIMTSGLYDIVKTSSKWDINTNYPTFYRQQFIQEDLTENKECILPRIYIANKLSHSLSRETNQANKGASKDFIESFLCNDGLPIALSPKYQGDDDLTTELTNRDPRLWNIIDNKYLPYLNSTAYPVTPLRVTPSGYLISKFRTPDEPQNEANKCTYDWYVFRYAEVLLIYAEAKVELNIDLQSAVDAINKLRERLDLPGQQMGRLSLNPPTDPLAMVNGKPRYGYPISNLLYEIRRERRIELAFEGFRWNDICRWKAGALIENPKTMYGIVVNQNVKDMYKTYGETFDLKILYDINDWDKSKTVLGVYDINSRQWNDKLYLDPLPLNQLSLNPNLNQNPGWK